MEKKTAERGVVRGGNPEFCCRHKKLTAEKKKKKKQMCGIGKHTNKRKKKQKEQPIRLPPAILKGWKIAQGFCYKTHVMLSTSNRFKTKLNIENPFVKEVEFGNCSDFSCSSDGSLHTCSDCDLP